MAMNVGLLLKNLLGVLPQPCTNNKYGCQEMLMKDQLPQHQLMCQFQKVNCAVLNCKNDGLSYLKYLDHVNDFHNVPVVNYQKKLDFSFSMSEDFSPLYYVWKAKQLTAFNKTFFEVGLIKNSLVYRWIYLLGFDEEAKKYHYKATLIGKSNF